MRGEIEAGFSEVAGADALRRVVATPSRMIESWALGDAEAFDANGYERPAFKGRPEELWGDEKDPQSNHPKRVLERALAGPASATVFADLAAHSDPERLEESCPESFAPFARDVRRALDDCLK